MKENDIRIIKAFEGETGCLVKNKERFIEQIYSDGLVKDFDEVVLENIEHFEIKCPYEFLDTEYIVNHDNDYILASDNVYLKVEAIDIDYYLEEQLIKE